MRKYGCNDDNVSKLLCVKCDTTEFEIIQKLDSGEIVARCEGCRQETELGALLGTPHDGAGELVTALRNFYAVAVYKAKQAKDEVGVARYCRRYDLLQSMLAEPGCLNPFDVFSMIESTNISKVEAEELMETALRDINARKSNTKKTF